MKIRLAILNDSAKLFNIEQQLFAKENFPLSKASFSHHIKNNLLFVAEIEEQIVGYILVLIKRKTPKIYSLGVEETFRGQNISSILLQRAFEELYIMDFKAVTLEVRTDNTNAISLYEKIGFLHTKTSLAFYLDGCDAFIMERSLAR